MKRASCALACLIMAAMATGCAYDAMIDDMVHNDFVGAQKDPFPLGVAGIWTGSMGPYLVTFNLTPEGGGDYCYSYATAAVVSQVKYVDGVILVQEGSKLAIKERSAERMLLHSPHYTSLVHTFYADPDLNRASAFCRSRLTPS